MKEIINHHLRTHFLIFICPLKLIKFFKEKITFEIKQGK